MQASASDPAPPSLAFGGSQKFRTQGGRDPGNSCCRTDAGVELPGGLQGSRMGLGGMFWVSGGWGKQGIGGFWWTLRIPFTD